MSIYLGLSGASTSRALETFGFWSLESLALQPFLGRLKNSFLDSEEKLLELTVPCLLPSILNYDPIHDRLWKSHFHLWNKNNHH